MVDLDDRPTVFPGSAAVSLFRLDRIRELGLAIDEQLRPSFEDQQFTARFVLGLDRPVVGILCRAATPTRRRRTADSAMQRSYADPGRYATVLERGYLDLIERARTRTGVIPDWLSHLVLYELTAYFRNHDRAVSRIALPAALVPRFHELLVKVCLALDPALVERHAAPGLRRVWMEVVAHAYQHPGWRPAAMDRTDVDTVMELQRIAYRYTGDLPAEGFSVGGRTVRPAFAKIRPITYFDRPVLFERILWLPSGGTWRSASTAVRS